MRPVKFWIESQAGHPLCYFAESGARPPELDLPLLLIQDHKVAVLILSGRRPKFDLTRVFQLTELIVVADVAISVEQDQRR